MINAEKYLLNYKMIYNKLNSYLAFFLILLIF